jgi:hypothetical protein
MDRAAELAQARGRVDAGHAAVRTARYDEALAAFAEALPVLRVALGPEHVEVRTLAEDIDTVRSMAGMWALGRSMGLGWDGQRDGAVTWRPDGSPDER